MGKSSGSQIALLYAYSLNTEGRIKAVIDGFGPTNFVDSSIVYDPNLGGNVAALLGGPYVTNKQLWHDASPIFYMSGAVPTVIIQGTLDQVVYPIQSLMLQDSLVNRSIPSIYFSWDGNGHGWDQEKWLQCSDAAWEFVHRYL
jgi:acetyl esterase/lipase